MKTTSSLLASLAFAASLLLGLSGCGQGETNGAGTATASQAPQNEIDFLINDYEKTTTQFVKTARKMKGGDVSLTLHYIDLGKEMRAYQPKLQAAAAKMTPPQSQRVAEIAAKAAPYLQK